jgi:hypothetical protein
LVGLVNSGFDRDAFLLVVRYGINLNRPRPAVSIKDVNLLKNFNWNRRVGLHFTNNRLDVCKLTQKKKRISDYSTKNY